MRFLILVALLLVFTVGSFTDMANAFASDHACAHHQMNQDDSVENEPCHSEDDQNQCDDCCCIHSHVMANSVTPIETTLNVNNQNVTTIVLSHYSVALSSLKRPPRL